MKYLCLVYLEEKRLPELPDEDCVEFDTAIRNSGHCIASEALESVQTATTVRVRDGKASVTDGPFAETKEQLAGFYMITAKNLDEAIGILTVNQHVGLTDAALRRLWAELPPRTPTTLTTEEAAERVAHGVPSVEDLLAARQTIPVIERVLSATLARAAPADRALVALHYGQAVPVARLAVQQHVSKATAHRRLTRVVEQCRQALTEAGVDRVQLAQALAFAGSELPPLLESLAETIAAPGRLSP